jgi:hypothetical protein
VKGQPKSRLSGVADLFRTPSPASTPEFSETPHSLYSDIPKTNQKHYNCFFRMYCRNKTF